MDAVGERASQLDVFTHRINELVKAYPPDNPPGALAQFQHSSKAALSETLCLQAYAIHTFAINMLTDDPGILDHVNRIQGVVGAEQPGSVLEIDLTRAIKRFCEAHHGCDVPERNASPAQGGVDVLSNRVWRITIPAIVADLVRHVDDVGVLRRRPSEAEGVHSCDECVIMGVGSRNRSASNQGSASHHGDAKSGQPTR